MNEHLNKGINEHLNAEGIEPINAAGIKREAQTPQALNAKH
jgi:hypothetical protein